MGKSQEFLLFRACYSEDANEEINVRGVACKVQSIRMKLPWKLYETEESRSLPETLSRIRWVLISKGRARMYFVKQEGKIIHTSFLIPSSLKFPFMGSEDFEIGPCYTDPDYKGLGVYHFV